MLCEFLLSDIYNRSISWKLIFCSTANQYRGLNQKSRPNRHWCQKQDNQYKSTSVFFLNHIPAGAQIFYSIRFFLEFLIGTHVASWLVHNSLKSEVCWTNGDIVVICRPRTSYCFQQSKPGNMLQETHHLYLNFSALKQLKVMLRNIQKGRTASLSYYKTLKLQNHWNNWFLLQKTVTPVITGGRSAGLWAKS